MDGRMDEWVDWWISGQMEEQTNGRMADGQVDG